MSTRPVFKLVPAIIVALVVSSLPLRSTAQNASHNSAFVFEPLVRRGDPVAESGSFFNCRDCEGGLAGFQSLNNLNYGLVWGDGIGTCSTGRFVVFQRSGMAIADSCHPTALGRFDSFGETAINDHFQVAFDATISVGGRAFSGTFLYSDGNITKIAAAGDPSPIGPIALVGGARINSRGDVALTILSGDPTSSENSTGVFVFTAGALRKVVATGDPSPIGGVFKDVGALRIHEYGQVLFWANVDTLPYWKEGLFLATEQGISKVVTTGEPMPGVESVVDAPTNLHPRGDMNFSGDVAFVTMLSEGRADSGIFLRSEGVISKIVAAGDRTPIGGNFASFTPTLDWQPLPAVHLNSFGAVAFSARVHDGSAESALFLASSRAIVKVVAIGDVVSEGQKLAGFRSPEAVRVEPSFAMNDQGNLAFSAYDKKGALIGILLATPVTPTINSVKLKRKRGVSELRVDGVGFIANDSEIQINGHALGELSYPDDFREDGGTTTRVVSRDSQLPELLASGEAVEIRVLNRLTARLSAPSQFTRK